MVFMARITKDPDVRKDELIDTAEKLFEKKGYDETAVSDIVKEVGVAQGTFYHYFDSKEDVLKALADRISSEVVAKVDKLIGMEGMGALDKMSGLTNIFRTVGIGRERLTDLLHEDRNAYLHHMIERKVMPPVIDGLAMIIEQGVAEGIFDVPSPRDAAIAVMGISQQFSEGRHDHSDRRRIDPKEVVSILQILERVLGAKKGAIAEHYLRKR